MRDERWLWPLRKVVIEGGPGAPMTLECGHKRPQASDIYGYRFPAKSRCWACWQDLPEAKREELRQAAKVRREKATARKEREWRAYRGER